MTDGELIQRARLMWVCGYTILQIGETLNLTTEQVEALVDGWRDQGDDDEWERTG